MKNKKIKAAALTAKSILMHLQIIFLALRACGIISWVWYWVLAPWIILWSFILIGTIFCGAAAITVINSEHGD